MRRLAELEQENYPDVANAMADRYPTLYWAYRLNQHPTMAILRRQVEARLLCQDADLDVIALRSGMTREQIDAYRHVFFDVQDRLQSTAWMLAFVFGEDAIRGFNPKANVELTIKLAGWLFGTWAVDAVSGRAYSGRALQDAGAVNDQLDIAESFDIRFRSYLTIRNMPLNEFTAQTLLPHASDARRRHDDKQKLADSLESGDMGGVLGVKMMVATLAQMALQVGSFNSPDLQKTLMTSVEPRANQLVALACGDSTAYDKIKTDRIPEVGTNAR